MFDQIKKDTNVIVEKLIQPFLNLSHKSNLEFLNNIVLFNKTRIIVCYDAQNMKHFLIFNYINLKMEVHHPHHPSHKKKWSEYFLEFFMLFFAVTLGFFAENKREELVEKHREQQYMQSLYEDIKKDTSMFNSLVTYENMQIAKIDTANMILNNNIWNDSTLKVLYRVNLKTLGNVRLNLNERTSSQLKYSGGMRMIENQEISNKISEYWELSDNIKNLGLTIDELKLKARDKSYSIFNQKYYSIEASREVQPGVKLMTYDNFIIAEYANRLNHIRNSMKSVRLPLFIRLNEKAVELLKDLKKEFNLNDNAKVIPVFEK